MIWLCPSTERCSTMRRPRTSSNLLQSPKLIVVRPSWTCLTSPFLRFWFILSKENIWRVSFAKKLKKVSNYSLKVLFLYLLYLFFCLYCIYIISFQMPMENFFVYQSTWESPFCSVCWPVFITSLPSQMSAKTEPRSSSIVAMKSLSSSLKTSKNTTTSRPTTINPRVITSDETQSKLNILILTLFFNIIFLNSYKWPF